MQTSEARSTAIQCKACKSEIEKSTLKSNYYVCPHCNNHLTVQPRKRVAMIMDYGKCEELFADLETGNPLQFNGYKEKIDEAKTRTGEKEAVLVVEGKIDDIKTVVMVMDSRFMMGSMGCVVGEKITRGIEYATKNRMPLIIFTASGGARMQEGILSLMQMAKTSAALAKHNEAGLFYISVITHPTTGGVTASFAMLGDIIIGEPGALIGFAGRRVIEQTIGESLPDNFQTTEYLLQHGMIDLIVPRNEMREMLSRLLKHHQKKPVPLGTGFKQMMKTYFKPKIAVKSSEAFENEAWEIVKKARKTDRPRAKYYIESIVTDFIELHGDRCYRDDPAVVGGIGKIGSHEVTIIAHNKGRSAAENMNYNFGMAHPEGYRKALRLMKQAEKFNRPIICLIDTPGAYCGVGAEERGQGTAIAVNLREMSTLQVPVIVGVIGEGGSGGALAVGVGNRVFMQQNTTYSILSPEGFASILWKDSNLKEDAAKAMKLTAGDLAEYGIIDDIIKEPGEGAHTNPEEAATYLKDYLVKQLDCFKTKSTSEIVKERYERFRKFGAL